MRAKEVVRRFLPRRIGAKRILAGPLAGMRMVTSWHDYPGALIGTTEKELVGWFNENVAAGETWLDVGAHYGYTAIALCGLVGREGRVFAFEPMLSTAGSLAQTRHINHLEQMTIVPIALGQDRDITSKSVTIKRGMAQHSTDVTSDHILVAGLDTFWPAIAGGNPRVDGVKIDVQGMEEAAIRGMRDLLAAHRPSLIVEFHGGANRREIEQLLFLAGYALPGQPIQAQAGDGYLDDRSYLFRPATVE